jgi:pre-mRNA-splicing factor CWC22
VALQLLALLLETPTEDSVELAVDFMTQCGQFLTESTPGGVNAIFERFRSILHEGMIERRV